MKTTPFLAILSAAAIISGCGGGGGGGNSGGGGNNPVSTPFKALTPGEFLYDVSGTLTTPTSGGAQTLVNSSLRVLRITAGATANQFSINTQDSLVIPNQAGSTAINLRADVTRQANNSVLINVLNPVGGDKVVTSANRIYIPGTFVTNTNSGTQTLSFNDGTTATYSFSIGGQETVTVPDGVFTAYVVTSSLVFGPNNRREGTYHYVPSLGTYVKSVETIVRPDGTTAVVTSSLDNP